jgi:hypothetical protein
MSREFNNLARFRDLAAECERHAVESRNPDDQVAWLALAREWLALADRTANSDPSADRTSSG